MKSEEKLCELGWINLAEAKHLAVKTNLVGLKFKRLHFQKRNRLIKVVSASDKLGHEVI